MKLAITLPLCSLGFTALNDFIFKLFADKMRSRGGFIAIIGVISTLMMLFFPIQMGERVGATLFWGLLGGTLSVTANIFLIEAMARQSATLCSTIYRLNMVVVVIGACLLLGEVISLLQWIAITCAILAIVAFSPIGSLAGFNMMGMKLALGACLLRGVMGIVYKLAINRGIDSQTIAFLTDVTWIIGGLLYVLFREKKWEWLRDRNVLGFGALSGLLVGGIVFCMAGSLNAGDASKVLPIAQMSFLATFVLSVIFLHEKVDAKKIIAVLLGIATVVLMAI